jgi:hypothetical protein
VEQVTRDQLQNMMQTRPALEFLSRRVDSKGDVLRRVIESTDGNVARTLTRNGKPLTGEDLQAERARLQEVTAESLRRKHRAETGEKYAREWIAAMPRAMVYKPVPGQPQIAGFAHPVLVLDFEPDPNFKPQSGSEALLENLDGRVWVDRTNNQLVQLHVHIRHDVNYALGIVAHVYAGGNIDVEMRPIAGRLFYTRVALDLSIRELMVHTQQIKQVVTTSDQHPLPAVPSTSDAVKRLLAE